MSLICDNSNCSYKEEIKTVDIIYNINKPCPICKENLLTQEDYNEFHRMEKIINFINKWFSWVLNLLLNSMKKEETIFWHHHDGKTTIEKLK